ASDGPLFSLRRHRFNELTFDDFLLSKTQGAFLEESVRIGRSILICGATGCGKTTFLALLLRAFSLHERVAIIEQIPELPALSSGWIRLAERPASLDGAPSFDLEQVFREVLRLRPDRLVVGEIRSREARPFLQAMASGHGGSMATLHAASPEQAFERV